MILNLVGPVAGAVTGTLIIGGVVQLVAYQVQRRRADEAFRAGLVARLSQAAYSIHYRMEHYERWVAYSSPPDEEQRLALAALEQNFIEDRVALGALQNEVDAYFGQDGPGASVHRMTDLIMVRFMHVWGAPDSQMIELTARVADASHSGLPAAMLKNQPSMVRDNFAHALEESMDRILRAPVAKGGGFRSTKILTLSEARDRPSGTPDEATEPQEALGDA